MNVISVMTSNPTIIRRSASLTEALKLMREIGCHHLPVLSSEKHLIGIISFSDCQRVLGDALKGEIPPDKLLQANETLVSSVMTPAPIIVEPDAPASEAARLMLNHFIGCLPVMRGETLVGIVTRSDLLMAFMMLSETPLLTLNGWAANKES